MGLFITLEEPSNPMRREADTAGIYHSTLFQRDYPKIQIITIRELLQGIKPALPPLVLPGYEHAEPFRPAAGDQQDFFQNGEGGVAAARTSRPRGPRATSKH